MNEWSPDEPIKIVGFDKLFNHNFYIEWIQLSRMSWRKGYVSDRFWERGRLRNGLLLLKRCDGILTVHDGKIMPVCRDQVVYIPGGLRYKLEITSCSKNSEVYVFDFWLRDADGVVIMCNEETQPLPESFTHSFESNFLKLYDINLMPIIYYPKRHMLAYTIITDAVYAFRRTNYACSEFLNISKAIEYIEQNYTKEISNEVLADMCYLSVGCFIRTFKRCYNTTPKKYILDLKLSKAKELLEITDKAVLEIAYETGFEPPAYFSNIFKKKFGITPTQYRKQKL